MYHEQQQNWGGGRKEADAFQHGHCLGMGISLTMEGGEWSLLQTYFLTPPPPSFTCWTFFTLTHKFSCFWFSYSLPCPAGGGRSEQAGSWLMAGASPPQYGKGRLIMWSAEHEIMTPYISKLKVLSFQITLVDLHCGLMYFINLLINAWVVSLWH